MEIEQCLVILTTGDQLVMKGNRFEISNGILYVGYESDSSHSLEQVAIFNSWTSVVKVGYIIK